MANQSELLGGMACLSSTLSLIILHPSDVLDRLPRHPDLGEEWAEYSQGSRSGDLERIWDWASDPDGELVFWIHSDPKQGKSTLARQLRGELQSKGRLAAAIFLSLLDSKGLESVLRLIGGEIGRIHRRVAAMVIEAIENCYGAPLGSHIEKIVRDPLLILQPPQPLIILIDSVTEWKLHANFIEQLSLLEPFTSFVRFIILGRSEPREGRYKNVSIRSYELGPVSTECMAEYLNDRFNTIKWKGVGRRPTPEDVLRLAALASGDFTRMEEVVSILRDLPISHYEDISKPIFDMALSDGSSFDMPGTGDALERSILLNRIALALRPSGHPERHWSLNNLSACLQQSYQKSQSAGVLEEAISLDREALALHPRGHPDRHYSCYNLANAVYDRFRRDGLIGDLEEAITLGREALLLLPEGNEHRLYLYNCFKIKRAVEDLQEAIALAEEALSLCPKDNHSYPVLPGWILSRKKELTG
jgi:tetratricopeptide (TPR) repeat protein